MKPRIRMQIVADGDPPGSTATATLAVGDPAPVAPLATVAVATNRFHALMVVEGVETGDDRIMAPGSLTWRDLPLPVMATSESDHGMLVVNPTVLIGNIDTVERRGNELHGWGPYLSNPDEEAARLIDLIERGELRGVSVDIDAVEFELLFPVTDETGAPLEDDWGQPIEELEPGDVVPEDPPPPPTEVGDDGVEREVIQMPSMKMRVTEGRIMGFTVVPFPAFQEAFIEPEQATPPPTPPDAIAASAFDFPAVPPREWFDMPEADGPTPLTITDDGQVFGHLAVWGECHVGISGECVEPPPSPSNYARFYAGGEIPVDDGGRVSVGRLTYHIGHADTKLHAGPAKAHYDDTKFVAADICAMDGEHGIWVCGAARPGLSAAQIREVMASPPSGDWRRFGRDLDMVGALCVNVPGFNNHRARVRKEDGLVASLIVSHPAPKMARYNAPWFDGMDPAVARRVAARIAATIGRTPKDRIAALAARVHGGD